MNHRSGSLHAGGISRRPRRRIAGLGPALALALLAGGTARAASGAPAAPREVAPPGAAARSLLERLRAAAGEEKCLGVVRGEDVASFVEAQGGALDPERAPAAFEAWSLAGGASAGPGSRLERSLARLQARLERTIAERGGSLPPERLVFGAIPTRSAYPWVLAVPSTDTRLVVLDDRLLDMVYAVVSAAFGTGLDGVAQSCDAVHEALRAHWPVRPRLSVNLRLFAGAARSGRYDLAPPHPAEVTALVRAAELFLLAHEYAHVLLGHALVHGPEQDLAADALAFDLVQATVRRDGSEADRRLARFGPEIMLFTQELLRTSRAVFAGDEAPPDTGEALEARLLGAPSPPRAGVVSPQAPAATPARVRASASARRMALREVMRVDAAGSNRDAAAFVERADACIFATLAPGLAAAGDRRRSADEGLEALLHTRAAPRRD